MSALLTPQLLRQLEQFQLLAARRAKSSAKGERRSRARGQSAVPEALNTTLEPPAPMDNALAWSSLKKS